MLSAPLRLKNAWWNIGFIFQVHYENVSLYPRALYNLEVHLNFELLEFTKRSLYIEEMKNTYNKMILVRGDTKLMAKACCLLMYSYETTNVN